MSSGGSGQGGGEGVKGGGVGGGRAEVRDFRWGVDGVRDDWGALGS